MNKMKCKYWSLLAIAGFAAALLYAPSPALAAPVAPSLGAAENFAILAGAAVTCTRSTINGNVGLANVGTVTQTICTINGTLHEGDTAAQLAYSNFLDAYDALATAPACTSTTASTSLGTTSLAPGVYCFDTSVTETNITWTLDGPCDATWIFRIGTTSSAGALTGTNFRVVNINPNCPCNNNVFWWTAAAATLTDNTGTNPFIGSILAGTDITVTGTIPLHLAMDGQALAGGTGTNTARNGAVTLTDATVNHCPRPARIPTLSEWAQIGMVLILVSVAVWYLRRRRAPVSA